MIVAEFTMYAEYEWYESVLAVYNAMRIAYTVLAAIAAAWVLSIHTQKHC